MRPFGRSTEHVMVAKAWAGNTAMKSGGMDAAKIVAQGSRKAVDEFFVQNEAVSLCLLVHRRAKTMRVVDFRAGPSSAKQRFVMRFAAKEGVEKVYTLVERDEVSTWVKMRFAKEASIPGFYKRSDAFMLGSPVTAATLQPIPEPSPKQSEMRISLRRGMPLPPSLPLSIETIEDDEDDDAPESTDTRAHDFAEKTLVRAKKRAKELAAMSLPVARITPIKESDTKKPLAAALKSGRAMTAFEPFGRDVERRYFSMTARGNFELVVSVESQACFGNAFVELLTAPKSDAEALATASSVRALCDKLHKEGAVCAFSLVPSDDIALASAFVFSGFRRTGLLVSHMVLGEGSSPSVRKDAIVFSRKLANPTAE